MIFLESDNKISYTGASTEHRICKYCDGVANAMYSLKECLFMPRMFFRILYASAYMCME